jgi:hypothetical protein
LPSVSRHGADPSAAGWLAAPGQRVKLRSEVPVSLPTGLCGVSSPPAGLSVNEYGVNIGMIRA